MMEILKLVEIEADELVVNLTRFEVFLPEKRQFFIDNADLFSDFGSTRAANPFFSRRIGNNCRLNGCAANAPWPVFWLSAI